MINVLIRHSVKDLEKWKAVFDEHWPARKDSGCLSERVMQSAADPKDVCLVSIWDSAENARGYLESEGLRLMWEQAGVIGRPDISFLNDYVEKKVHAA